jgi:hypothetical protein
MLQIIHVREGERLPALLARLDAVAGPTLLVVPAHNRALANPARLQLIQRRAARRRQPLAIVAVDAVTQELARDLGLPVYTSVEAAARAAPPPLPPADPLPDDLESEERRALWQWRARYRRARARLIARSRAHPWSAWTGPVALALLLAAFVSLVVVTAALIVPAAYVTLTPARRSAAVTVDVVATTGVDAPDADARLVPARRLEVQIEGNGVLPTTGRRDAPDQRAVGAVTFINRQAAGQEIPAGTVVRTSTGSNVRFRTTAPAVLGPGVGATAVVPIEAIDPGPAGNVRSGTITQVDGPLAPLVRVINEQPTTGGSVRQVSVVTNADKDRLRQAVLQQVQQLAQQRLSESLTEGEFLPPESITTLILAETFDHFLDEPTDTLGLRLRVLARGLAVNEAAAQEIAARAMEQQAAGGADVLRQQVRYQRGPVTVREERVSFSVTATGEAVGDIDPAAVRAAIAGLPLAEAEAILSAKWALAEPPQIRLEPDWIGRVPWVPFRIRVQVNWTPTLGQ